MPTSRITTLRAEATSLFLGSGGVVGIAEGVDKGLTVLLTSQDAPRRPAVSAWAAANSVEIRFLAVGVFDVKGVK